MYKKGFKVISRVNPFFHCNYVLSCFILRKAALLCFISWSSYAKQLQRNTYYFETSSYKSKQFFCTKKYFFKRWLSNIKDFLIYVQIRLAWQIQFICLIKGLEIPPTPHEWLIFMFNALKSPKQIQSLKYWQLLYDIVFVPYTFIYPYFLSEE